MTARRILVVGAGTPAGARLAAALAGSDPATLVVAAAPEAPEEGALGAADFVRVGTQHLALQRLVDGARIDTVVDCRLVPDTEAAGSPSAHEQTVIGTMNLLAACGGPGSPVRKVVIGASAQVYGSERDDPAFFTEEMERPRPPRTAGERDLVDAERAAAAFAARHPDVVTTVVRFADAIGPGARTPAQALLSLPALPAVLGFDPRWQFVAEEDVTGVLAHAVATDLRGPVNAAADGVLALSEVASLLGKRIAPVLPPWGTGAAAAALRALGAPLREETVRLLRYGRGLDNRRLKASGYRPTATSREAVLALARHLRVGGLLARAGEAEGADREVDAFLRRTPGP
jgi:UDP-glucose 4-epimerase